MKVNLQKLSRQQWNIEHYDGCPAFTEMTAHGFTKNLYKSKMPVYKINISYYSKGEGDWMSLLSDHKRIGSTIVKEFIKNKNVITELHKELLKNFKIMMKKYYKWFKYDISQLDDNELMKWADKIYDFYRRVSLPGLIDGFMFYADKRFDYLIKQFCSQHKITNYPRVFSILSAPTNPSFINKETEDLQKIVKIINKRGYKDKYELDKLISKHLFKYSWIKSSYAGYKEYALSEVKREIRDIIKDKSKKENILKINKKEKEKLYKKYKFNPEIKAISRLIEIFVKWQDQRKIYSLTFVTLQSKILKEIAKRKKIDYNFLRYTYSKELKSILDKSFNMNKLKKRKNFSLFIYRDGGIINIIVGEQAKRFLKKVSQVNVENTKEIKGMTASLGKAIGRVKIVMSAKYINKIKKGDVLVAPMTRPEHLVGMKKAVAIVTDDGGITCHAAIVARELKIPCIIGTKIATKALKDNELVEVDTERGIIKIFKN